MAGLAPWLSAEPSASDWQTVWSYAASNQPLEAKAMLGEMAAGESRTRELAEAILALARTPLAEGDWHKLEPRFAHLTTGDDDVAAQALYLQARMHQAQKLNSRLSSRTANRSVKRLHECSKSKILSIPLKRPPAQLRSSWC